MSDRRANVGVLRPLNKFEIRVIYSALRAYIKREKTSGLERTEAISMVEQKMPEQFFWAERAEISE